MFKKFATKLADSLIKALESTQPINNDWVCSGCHKKFDASEFKGESKICSMVCLDCYRKHGGLSEKEDMTIIEESAKCGRCEKELSSHEPRYSLLDSVSYYCTDCNQNLSEEVTEMLNQKDREPIREEVTKSSDDSTHTLTITCPSCNASFQHVLDLTESKKSTNLSQEIPFKAYCTYCGQSFSGSIQRQTSLWKCEYCSQGGFETKEEAEAHERRCPSNKKRNRGHITHIE